MLLLECLSFGKNQNQNQPCYGGISIAYRLDEPGHQLTNQKNALPYLGDRSSFEQRLVPRYAGRRDVNNSGLILVQAGLPAHPHTIQPGQ
ncbi:hypothetical protein H9L39_01380 [Fusarium oxysporum f. sp. albedinis]|nr:hypothetical protein H9L39_01380 [Fusarium oxysporum f. sp. albedinis]